MLVIINNINSSAEPEVVGPFHSYGDAQLYLGKHGYVRDGERQLWRKTGFSPYEILARIVPLTNPNE